MAVNFLWNAGRERNQADGQVAQNYGSLSKRSREYLQRFSSRSNLQDETLVVNLVYLFFEIAFHDD